MKNLILTSKITAATSFIIGTILLAVYLYLDKINSLEAIGFGFIIIAFWVNLILLVILIVSVFVNPKLRIEILKTCMIMLLNIPIAISYFFLVLWSLDNNF